MPSYPEPITGWMNSCITWLIQSAVTTGSKVPFMIKATWDASRVMPSGYPNHAFSAAPVTVGPTGATITWVVAIAATARAWMRRRTRTTDAPQYPALRNTGGLVMDIPTQTTEPIRIVHLVIYSNLNLASCQQKSGSHSHIVTMGPPYEVWRSARYGQRARAVDD